MFNSSRPNVLSIAGFDPSAGAGILADIKTFEQCDVYGMGVISALTYQNDKAFEKVEWMSVSQIIEQIEVLKQRFYFNFIKIGLIESLEILNSLITYLTAQDSTPKIIWDPILKASAGFEFHTTINKNLFEKICNNLYLITPNLPEALQLGTHNNAITNSNHLSKMCNVYLKGGHNKENKGNDVLFKKDGDQFFLNAEQISVSEKHGSGCVLSSAITALLAKGIPLEDACVESKKYVSSFLSSNNSLLGYHSGITAIEHE